MRKERFFAVAVLCQAFLIATGILLIGGDYLAAGITQIIASATFVALLLMVARM